jgi:hypothetical protein
MPPLKRPTMTVRALLQSLDHGPWGHAIGDLKIWQALLLVVGLSAVGAYVRGLAEGIREERRLKEHQS